MLNFKQQCENLKVYSDSLYALLINNLNDDEIIQEYGDYIQQLHTLLKAEVEENYQKSTID